MKKLILKPVISVVAIIFVILVSGCTIEISEPSEAEALKVFKTSLNPNMLASGKIKVVEFKKTNGQSAIESGIKSYKFYYKASYKLPSGLNLHCSPEKISEHNVKMRSQGFWQFNPPRGCSTAKYLAPGTVVENIEGTILFQESENGWLPIDWEAFGE